MDLIDTHCHLDLDEFDDDRDEVIARAWEAGLAAVITIGIDPASSARAVELARTNARIFAAVGHHPHEAKLLTGKGLDSLRELARAPEVVAFGEIGLDYYRNHSPREVQKERFDELIRLGRELDLPLIIHDRDAHDDVLEHLRGAGADRGIIHCFSGDYPLARKLVDLGFYISIPGTITFPKAEELRDVVRRLPLDALLVETDAPFLAPAPRRGRRNEPALVRHTAAELARVKDISLELAAHATTANARRAFNLPENDLA